MSIEADNNSMKKKKKQTNEVKQTNKQARNEHTLIGMCSRIREASLFRQVSQRDAEVLHFVARCGGRKYETL
jgi:hypothetical protein